MSRTVIRVTMDCLPMTDNVPAFLPILVSFIKNNSSAHGIFRIPGNQATVMKINESLGQHCPTLPPKITVYDAVSFLKLWLKSLPEPLIPPSLINIYFQSNNTNSIEFIISQLVSTNRKCFAYIISILKSVLEHTSQNEMTLDNIMICFTSSLSQDNRDLADWFPLAQFYRFLSQKLNSDGSDFVFSS